MTTKTAVVVGAGIFGLTAALELQERGWTVRAIDPGPIPHPLAASTDISKAVRLEYGPDEQYVRLMEDALEGWRRWSRLWDEPLFHETGVTFLRRTPMTEETFERQSYELLRRRGHRLERLNADEIQVRFPAWSTGAYVDGLFDPEGGFAESGKVVARLARTAREVGVDLTDGLEFSRLLDGESGATGVVTVDGDAIRADVTVLAMGSWTPHLLPSLANAFQSAGMPVFHLRPESPAPFDAPRFPVFGADIAATGYYGFPVNRDGVVKIANHGIGRPMHPHSPDRYTTAEEEANLRAFLAETFPALVPAPLVYSRICLYCDTRDGHFWIDRDPDRPGLVVATGGSGHAFKFAPVLGRLIADAVEEQDNPWRSKFRWRPEVRPAHSEEAARRQE